VPVWGIRASHSVRRETACHDGGVGPTVLIVDDHAGFREAAREMLEVDGFAVVGEASDAATAMIAAETLRPAVVLLDIQLPGLDGFAAAAMLAALPDPPAVVLISSREVATYGAQVQRAPARGFIEKAELSGARLIELLA
jgi:DNA-binding NarL/FixJ family response regulator